MKKSILGMVAITTLVVGATTLTGCKNPVL